MAVARAMFGDTHCYDTKLLYGWAVAPQVYFLTDPPAMLAAYRKMAKASGSWIEDAPMGGCPEQPAPAGRGAAMWTELQGKYVALAADFEPIVANLQRLGAVTVSDKSFFALGGRTAPWLIASFRSPPIVTVSALVRLLWGRAPCAT